MKMVAAAFVLFTLSIALPADATVTVTRARDFGFLANWGLNEPCPAPAEGRRLIGAQLMFAENTLSGGSQIPVAFLELHYANDCSGEVLPLPFDASGSTDPNDSNFPFNQQYTIDKRPGARGLAFATYQATIPVFVEGNDCLAQAQVNIRLDGVGPLQRQRNFFRSDESGSVTYQFLAAATRTAEPSGSIVLTDPNNCVDDRVPTQFAVHPQTVDQNGNPASFIFRTRELTITRTRP